MNSGTELWEDRAKQLIPGGTQLLSKRAEQFLPKQWPSYYQSANGTQVTDLDGNEYVDMSIMGVGACILGYNDSRVDEEVVSAIENGSMATLNSPEEVQLSERLVDLDPWADMVRLARTGGEAMAIAVRLARASTDRGVVAFCGYHGWHDWYLAANLDEEDRLDGHLLPGLEPKGVPTELSGTAKPFQYNDLQGLKEIVRENEIGTIVMEPVRNTEPNPHFLSKVREIADEIDTPLIFDEITSGFRTRVGGVYADYDVEPDVVVYGKALGNGYPIAAVVGRREIMDMAQESFVSSTFWTERIGPTAALATLDVLEDERVPRYLLELGGRLQSGLKRRADEHALDVNVAGLPPLTHFTFAHEQGQAAKTLFTQKMLDRGYLAGDSIYLSQAHTRETVDAYLEDVDVVFEKIAASLDSNEIFERLDGPVAHSKFERLN